MRKDLFKEILNKMKEEKDNRQFQIRERWGYEFLLLESKENRQTHHLRSPNFMSTGMALRAVRKAL